MVLKPLKNRYLRNFLVGPIFAALPYADFAAEINGVEDGICPRDILSSCLSGDSDSSDTLDAYVLCSTINGMSSYFVQPKF